MQRFTPVASSGVRLAEWSDTKKTGSILEKIDIEQVFMKMTKVFFFHIPKCAGMSIWHHLWEIFGSRNVLQIGIKNDVEKFKAAPRAELERYAAIGGHHWLSTYRERLGNLDGYFKITTLRDPIDRIISSYNFIKNFEIHTRHREANRTAFEKFALTEMSNMQTRLLSGTTDYRKAIEVLEGWFDFYATSDRVNELLKELSLHLQTPFRQERHENVSKKEVARAAIDPAFLSRLEEIHQADIDLYRYIEERPATMSNRNSA